MAAKWEGAWQQLLSLCRRRGFIAAQQLAEGDAPTKDGYLTLGSALKRNIANEWLVVIAELQQQRHRAAPRKLIDVDACYCVCAAACDELICVAGVLDSDYCSYVGCGCCICVGASWSACSKAL